MSKEIIKKVFLEDLPRKEGIGKNKDKQTIDWNKSIGYKVKFIYDDVEGEVEIVDYKEKYIHIKYLNNPILIIFIGNFLKCQLGKLLNKTTNEFKYNIGNSIKDKYRDITIIDRKLIIEERIYDDKRRDCKRKIMYNKKYYKYRCNKCGFDCGEHFDHQSKKYKDEHWVVENNLSKGSGCACCSGHTLVVGINNIPITAPWMVKYFQGGYDEAKMYTKNSSKSIYPVCPECGRVKDKPMKICNIYKNHSIGCKFCGDGISYGEKIMISVLEQIQVEFNTHKIFEWSNRKEYDFYIPNNIIIETHGEQHYKSGFQIKSTRKVKTLEEEQDNDEYKKQLALSNGIKEENYIVIDCRYSELEFIKQNILKSNLSELFNLSNINWDKVQEFALSSRVKEACDYWNNGIESTKEIGEIIKVHQSTVERYLKKGSAIGLCDYNGSNKQVEIFKDGISLGIYPSCAELERQSEELFGVKLNQSKISLVATGKQKTYKGYIFKYIYIKLK